MSSANSIVHFAWAHFAASPGQSLLRSAVIATALSIVLLLEGFEAGLLGQLGRASTQRDADLIAVQEGVTNFLATRSKLPQMSRSEIEAVAGVEAARPMALIPVIFEQGGRKSPIFFVVEEQAGAKVPLVSGRRATGLAEAVVDRSLAAIYDLEPGDEFAVADYRFEIVGITSDQVAMFTPFVFISYDDLIEFYFSSDVMGDVASVPLVGFLMIRLASDADPARVMAAVEAAIPAVDIHTPSALAANDILMGRTLFGPVLDALISVSHVIVLLVLSMIIYASVAARRHSYGVLRALGFGPPRLLATMACETMFVVVVATPLALAIAVAVAGALEAWAPIYALSVAVPDAVLRSAAAAMLLALLATAVAFRSVAQIDPASAFRG